MLDTILDAVAVLSPLAIAIMSVVVGMKLAKDPQGESHKYWWWGIFTLGIVCSAATLWQQQRGRKAHSDEVSQLTDSMTRVKGDLQTAETNRAVEAADFKARLDVIGRFIAHPPANFDPKQIAAVVHAMTGSKTDLRTRTLEASKSLLIFLAQHPCEYDSDAAHSDIRAMDNKFGECGRKLNDDYNKTYHKSTRQIIEELRKEGLNVDYVSHLAENRQFSTTIGNMAIELSRLAEQLPKEN